jgi:phage anti-repressor protein
MNHAAETREMVPVVKQKIGEIEQQTVNARDLHAALEVKTKFVDWIKNRLIQCGYIENQDFVSFPEIRKRETGASYLTEYLLTIDVAKEICMMERNDKGRQIRRYFIECERRLLDLSKQAAVEFESRPSLVQGYNLALIANWSGIGQQGLANLVHRHQRPDRPRGRYHLHDGRRRLKISNLRFEI